MKNNLTVTFGGKALVIRDPKTNSLIAAQVTKEGLVYHKSIEGNKRGGKADQLFSLISAYLTSFQNKKYSYSQRLKAVFSLIRTLRNANTITKLHNRLLDATTKEVVYL